MYDPDPYALACYVFPLSHLNHDTLPYLFIKDENGFVFYDIKTNMIHKLLSDISTIGAPD
eukprot:CAMPEP_0170551182 /NCGR_PEP_ID=MMETSP0211-20121228/9207_1 /TAXON_ID=311385 /ORGANISM="Pseudokeronopsis sp., Strain OXSARD2" /LENGTH=59 /DNA_ID=CAMNT_0010858195 /DNA_START=1116 /DNA_END=1295 /DNA_ORIENTATION=-